MSFFGSKGRYKRKLILRNFEETSEFLASLGVCMVTHISKSTDQPGKVANLASGQLNREK